jgi:hypothetical protein
MSDNKEIDDIEEITRDETIVDEDEDASSDVVEDEEVGGELSEEDYRKDGEDAEKEEDKEELEDLPDVKLKKESDRLAKLDMATKKPKAAKKVKKKKPVNVTKYKFATPSDVKKIQRKKIVPKKKVVKKRTPAKHAMDEYHKSLKAAWPTGKPKKKVVKKHKVVKKTTSDKSMKRGPKGPQWLSWRIPYQESSTSGTLFMLAMHKHGLKFKELKKVCKNTGANPAVMFKELRGGHCRGWGWTVDDAHDRLRITNVKIVDKRWKSKHDSYSKHKKH